MEYVTEFKNLRAVTTQIQLNDVEVSLPGLLKITGKVRYDTKTELINVRNEYRKQLKEFGEKKLKPFIQYYKTNRFDKKIRRTKEEARKKTLADIKLKQLSNELSYYERNIKRLNHEISKLK